MVVDDTTLQGRRAERISDLGKPCDYAVMRRDGEVTALWFVLPNGVYGRVSAENHSQRGEPTWRIVVHGDETVSVSPSIICEVRVKDPDTTCTADPSCTEWHGWLRKGCWSPA